MECSKLQINAIWTFKTLFLRWSASIKCLNQIYQINYFNLETAEAEARKKNTPTHLDVQLEENVNIVVAQAKAEGMEEARNVEDAIAVLG